MGLSVINTIPPHPTHPHLPHHIIFSSATSPRHYVNRLRNVTDKYSSFAQMGHEADELWSILASLMARLTEQTLGYPEMRSLCFSTCRFHSNCMREFAIENINQKTALGQHARLCHRMHMFVCYEEIYEDISDIKKNQVKILMFPAERRLVDYLWID